MLFVCFREMKQISSAEISSWSRFYRGNFINSLSGFKSVSLIGTINETGHTNLAIFSNIVHLGADPALVGYVNRPLEAAPHTIANIQKTGMYTINHIHDEIVPKAHQTSAKYPEEISEFDAVGLTPQFVEGIKAPFVRESRVKYALALREIIPISWNNTFFVIGEIQSVLLDASLIPGDGFLELEKAGSICSLGLDGYYNPTRLIRYAYAKADQPLKQIG